MHMDSVVSLTTSLYVEVLSIFGVSPVMPVNYLSLDTESINF